MLSRRHYWCLLVGVTLYCSASYLLLTHRVFLTSSSSLNGFSPSFYRSLLPQRQRRSKSNSSFPSLSFSSLPFHPQYPSLHRPPALMNRTSASPPNTFRKKGGDSDESGDGGGGGDGDDGGGGAAGGGDVPLLTLFSTWVNRHDLELVRKLTLRNWAQLKPRVLSVLFSNDSAMVTQARQHGWETLPVSRHVIGLPILKNMYLDTISGFNSILYAFANGDILFTDDLLDSLKVILKDLALPIRRHPLLVIGQRTNVAWVTEEEARDFHTISQMAKERGQLFQANAEDFFITDAKFPWDSIPEVVPGRVAYDNWLVLHAIHNRHVVVDITKTATVVHQTTSKGNHEGHTHANLSYNRDVLKRHYKRIYYRKGLVSCAPWRTLRNSEGKVVVKRRVKRARHC